MCVGVDFHSVDGWERMNLMASRESLIALDAQAYNLLGAAVRGASRGKKVDRMLQGGF